VNNPAKALITLLDPTLRFLLWGNIKEDGSGTKVSVQVTTKLVPAP